MMGGEPLSSFSADTVFSSRWFQSTAVRTKNECLTGVYIDRFYSEGSLSHYIVSYTVVNFFLLRFDVLISDILQIGPAALLN
jgi:hypothetical protein